MTTYSYVALCGCGVSGQNLQGMTDANGNETRYRYDEMHRLIEETGPDPDGSGPLTSPITTYTYDAAGRMVSMTDPNSAVAARWLIRSREGQPCKTAF